MRELLGMWYCWLLPLLSSIFSMVIVLKLCGIDLLGQIAAFLAFGLSILYGWRKLDKM